MRLIIYLMAFVFFGLLASCQRHTPAPVKETNYKKYKSTHLQARRNKYQQEYTHVKKGDTLYSIGFKHNLDYKTLARINNIRKPYHIYPGQKLKLINDQPLIATSQSNNSKTHEVPHKKKLVATSQNNKPKITKVKPEATVIKTSKAITKPKPKPKVIIPPVVKAPKKTNNNLPAPSSNSRWIWPLSGRIISTFSTTDTSRKGIDIASKQGTAVFASNNGTVVYSGDGLRGYGELIIIKHNNNLLSAYAHNTKRLVKEGETVKQGHKIATSGKGTDGKALLHFEIRKNGQPVNPLNYLPKK